MARKEARSQSWKTALDQVEAALVVLELSLQKLSTLKEEYEDWMENLPDSLKSSSTADKLQEVCEIDVQENIELVQQLQEWLEDVVQVDLPRGPRFDK